MNKDIKVFRNNDDDQIMNEGEGGALQKREPKHWPLNVNVRIPN
jgi:hypothetical protein